MARNRPMNDLECRRIEYLYLVQRLSTYEVSRRVRRSQSGVYLYLKGRGLVRSQSEAATNRAADRIERAIRLYLRGHSIRRAAEIAGVCSQALSRHLKKRGLGRSFHEAVQLNRRVVQRREAVMQAGRMHIGGASLLEIACEIGLTSDAGALGYVRDYYQLMGMAYQSQIDIRRTRLAGLLEAGVTSREQLARELGVCQATVYHDLCAIRRRQPASPTAHNLQSAARRERLERLQHALRRNPDVTSADLARQLGVNRQTIYRDLEAIQAA